MRITAFIILSFLFFSSFTATPNSAESYELILEAKGCHYRIVVNDNVVDEGKTYQRIEKTILLKKELADSGEQKIDVSMFRISREIPLKTTQAYLNLKLEKHLGDSVVLIKEVKLPTFPYDDDEVQPQSIAGSIQFELKTEE